jgi:MFS family permease
MGVGSDSRRGRAGPGESASGGDGRLYTGQFFQVFAAVILFMTGVSLQFHFGQYLAHLGHGVDTLGLVLGISMVGTLSIRLFVGRWIDRFGCRPTWFIGTLLVALAVGSIQFTEHLWLIAALRAVSTMAAAAVMTTVAVFAAQMAPPHRRAESIGIIGLGGFLGMTIGPTLGDWIFSGAADSIVAYRVFFSASAGCSLLAGMVMMLLSRPATGDPALERTAGTTSMGSGPHSTIRVVLAHWPGSILLVGAVFSMVFCLQSLFLERLAEERGFYDIKLFFLTYCPTAITLRIIFRRLPERIGRTRTLLFGMTLLAVGLFFMIGVRTQAQLILPGFLMGAGHCFIFPSMVDLAADRLPAAHRGTGTALILAAGDLGMLIGYWGLGVLIDARGFDAAVLGLALVVAAGAGVFAVTDGLGRARRSPKPAEPQASGDRR